MGCGGSKDKEEAPNAVLDHWMDTVHVAALDSMFYEASSCIHAIEELRSKIIDDRDDMIISSGACALKDPDMEAALYGVMWKLSVDNSGKFVDAGLGWNTVDNAFLLTGTKNTEKGKTAFNHFNTYAKGLVLLPGDMKTAGEKMLKLSEDVIANMDKYTSQITEAFKDKPMDGLSNVNKAKKNFAKIKLAADCTKIITKELDKNIAFMLTTPTILKDVTKLAEVDKIGAEGIKNKHVEAYIIVWHNAPKERKFGAKPEEGVKLWDNRKVHKKVAKEKKPKPMVPAKDEVKKEVKK